MAEDRIEPAIELARSGDIKYLCYDALSEKEIQLASLRKLRNSTEGHDKYIEKRLEPILPFCANRGLKLVSNMGSANPLRAAEVIKGLCRKLDVRGLKIASIVGDDVLSIMREIDPVVAETGQPVSAFGERVISANAYIGAEAILTALRQGADIVVGGRIADASLYLGPILHEFGWKADDWDRIARGLIVGHIMECGGQSTGGNFADPGYKDVLDLHRLGFPIAEVFESGETILTKVPGSGGMVTTATVTEQLLYEMGDPANYIEPDVIVDITEATVEQAGKDRVWIRGVKGKPRPLQLKVALGVLDGFIGEGMLFFGGPGAYEKAKLAGEIIMKRLDLIGVKSEELRIDLVGVNAIFQPNYELAVVAPREVGIRVAGRTCDRAEAAKIAYEVNACPTNGPAGMSALSGGLTRDDVREVLAYYHTFIARERVRPTVSVETVN